MGLAVYFQIGIWRVLGVMPLLSNTAYFKLSYLPRSLIKGTGSQFRACSLIKLLFSNLLLILSVNNPTDMYLNNLRV